MRDAHAADSTSVRASAQDQVHAEPWATVADGCPASLRIELFGDMRVERNGRDVTAELPH
jgi:hypothetical protein